MTWHAAVHPGYRRRGIYRAVIERVLETTRELGFTSVVSSHAPGNNPAIIAKLSLGFRIDRLDLDALHGPSLWLRYFHDPDELAAYEFRCGLATLTPELLRGATARGRNSRISSGPTDDAPPAATLESQSDAAEARAVTGWGGPARGASAAQGLLETRHQQLEGRVGERGGGDPRRFGRGSSPASSRLSGAAQARTISACNCSPASSRPARCPSDQTCIPVMRSTASASSG